MLVIGVGNSYRGDDGVGPAVHALLREERPPTASKLDYLCRRGESLYNWHGLSPEVELAVYEIVQQVKRDLT